MRPYLFSGVLLATLAGCALNTSAQPQPTNIALGKTATFNIAPNYSLSSDPDDKLQLTDGQYSSQGQVQEVENTRAIWVQKSTVGWTSSSLVTITLDLGEVQPIAGVSYSTAAGASDVAWPNAIYMAVSNDNKTWRGVGDLVALSRKNGAPPDTGYAEFRYVTRDLKTHGRYITFAVGAAPYHFVDEIEVYAGDRQWLNAPLTGETFQDAERLKELLAQSQTVFGAQKRLQSDGAAVSALVQAANIPAARRSTLLARLNEYSTTVEKLDSLPSDFKAIIPFNDAHRGIFATHGELLAAQGLKPLTVWKQHRYQWLPLLAKPAAGETTALNFSMLKNQFRSDALLLTNATGAAQTVTLNLANAPRDAQSGWLQVSSVAWTDTAQSSPVADALLPLAAQNGIYSVDVPAGMTRKVWLTVDSSKVSSGAYQSTLDVESGGQKNSVPFALHVAQVAMNQPRLSLGMWDYTNGNGYGGLTPQNRAAAITLMRSHYVDTPWATSDVLPRPEMAAFDAQNNLKEKLDFTSFDQWVALWPDARNYFVYAAVNTTFAGATMGTPEFNARVGNWAKAVSSHVEELGLQPKQLGILLVDEPLSDAQDEIVAAWAEAINGAAPELTLFQDPNWARPDQTKIQEAITEIDLLCLQVPIYYRGGEPVREYFANLKNQGKTLWFYQCTGPTRGYDPQTYFRYQAWHTFSVGGVGQGFWAFGDTGNAPTSWNEYASGGMNFAPAFLGKDSVNNSVHWDAVREGVEDYEELAMLRDAIKASGSAAWKQQAQQTLDNAVKAVTGSWNNDYDWKKASNSELADAQLQKVRALLISKGN